MTQDNVNSRDTWETGKFSWPAVAALVAISALVFAVLFFWLHYPIMELIGSALLVLVIVVIGILNRRFKIIESTINRLFTAYFRFLGWLCISLGPLLLFTWLSRYVLANHMLSFQLIIFLLWGLLLVWAVTLIFTHKRRELFFEKLQKLGSFTPIVYAFNLLMIAVTFFSSITYALAQRGVISLTHSQPAAISHGAVTDFYMWHFLDAVPFLEVNKTLHWDEPLTYSSGWIGFTLLVFKILVILPVIAAFAWYWKKVDSDR